MVMNVHEQRMCETQAEFFKLSSERLSCSSFLFIARFMNSDIAKQLDKTNDLYNYSSPDNLISLMLKEYPSTKNERGRKIPSNVMKWIGYIYRAYSIIKKKESSMIYKNIKAQEMVALYDSFHTFSPEYCVDRLEEIINEKNGPALSDYEVFKQIYGAN